MTNNIKRLSRGFTIIEVMIVLVIAGLILVIVFLAIPQLQRTQRDNARQNAVIRLKSEMETYASNNQGKYPFGTGGACGVAYTVGAWNDFWCRYIQNNVDIKDPTGSDIIGSNPDTDCTNGTDGCLRGYASFTLPDNAGETAVVYAAKCAGENIAASGTVSVNSKKYAIVIGLDRDNTRYCVDSG